MRCYFDRVRHCLEVGQEIEPDKDDGGNPENPAQEILAHEDLRVSFGTRTVRQHLAGFCRSMAMFNVGAKRGCPSTIFRTRY